MALWLGKVGIQEDDLPEYFRKRKKLMEFYLDDMKFRVVIKLTLDELKEFENVVIKKYGKFTALNSKKAAKEAIKTWSQENTG